jgi:hypothetical protein
LSEGWETADARIPNLYAGQTLYVSARAGSQIPLELSARTPAGQPVQLHFQPALMPGAAPYLHWSKSRIQRLVAGNRDLEAVALSISANLLCRLTAFVAWDESEKVAVSRHELVQPNMEPAAGGGPGIFRLRDTVVQHTGICEPLYLMSRNRMPKRTSDINHLGIACKMLGGEDWRPFYENIQDWFARITDIERETWTEALDQLVEKIRLYSGLIAVLGNDAMTDKTELMKRVREFLDVFRALQHGWKRLNVSEKDMENLRQQVEVLKTSPSVEQLASIREEIRKQAIEAIKSFAQTLPVRK